jgi:hypothetical protein
MRRRWQVDHTAIKNIVVTWFSVGFVAFWVGVGVWRNHHGPTYLKPPFVYVWSIWLAPFAIAATMLLALFAAAWCCQLVSNPPIRRVTEAVLDDLREVDTMDSPALGQEQA